MKEGQMPISPDTAARCMNWEGCDIRTLLYLISLEDVCDDELWETDLITSMIVKTAEEMAKNPGDANEYAIDLGSALERIHVTNSGVEIRKMQDETRRKACTGKA